MEHLFDLLLRGILAYFSLLILTRIMGKRELSKMNFSDFVVGITIGSIAAKGAVDHNQPFTNYIPALVIILVLEILFSYLSMKFDKFRLLNNGEPIILMENGRILEQNLRKARLNVEELASQLRLQSIFSFQDVETVLIEQNGGFSVQLKPSHQAVTMEAMSIVKSRSGLPRLLIKDGKLVEKELTASSFTLDWVHQQLSIRNIASISDIMLGQIDRSGFIYIDLYEKEQTT
ncbi:DUF421 domain-containing protein [Priestia flexa]|uniref:DUF421 domain-containing protein n=1 Tax=Priestia flexa TaxID=86664 RepID=UPI000E69456A|nr:DUF421 domain-containing protein [Priestia flexa]RIV11883.1 DUF421 domain-containing protein [Priestia flexa]